jgi:CO/xanthine dehydrogenase Mo-binding subunit
MAQSRREFLKGAGVLIVSFGATALVPDWTSAQGPFETHPSHINSGLLDSWIAVAADGTIIACTGKCDFGQGILTAQTQLVAEELCVPIERVKLIQCDTDRTPDQGTTSGSQSTPTNFNAENLALAAASAREALLRLASAKLNEPLEQLTVAGGVITSRSGRRLRYEELVGGKHFEIPLNPNAKRKPFTQWTVLGKSVPSLDRTALMTGRFEFVQSVRVPGMLHGRVVRPPQMGATLEHVDEQTVRTIPGLVKVVVRKDFVGVVAEMQHHAAIAARRLVVHWKQGPRLPERNGFFEYVQKQPSHDVLSVDSGDMESRLGRSARVVRASYTYPYQMHGSVGTSCAVADVRSDRATVWSATQSVYPTRSVLAKILGLPLDSVRVIFVRGSGCYGLNGADAASFDAAVLSQAVGRPVRLQFSREDEMMWENFGAACLVQHKAALAPDGSIAAWDRENWMTSLGSRPGDDRPGNVISGMLLGYEPEPFKPAPASPPKGKLRNNGNSVPAYFAGCIDGSCQGGGTIRTERALTRTVRSPFFTGPLRSPSRIQNTFANECFMDELCAAANADPLAYRLRHLRDPRMIAVLKAAAQAAGWQERPLQKAKVTPGTVMSGRGIGCVNYEGDNGYAALVCFADVDLGTGLVHPKRFVVAVDCGPISNPDGLRNQLEGGILHGISRSLVEEVLWNDKRVTSVDWKSYKSLYLDLELPVVETVLVAPGGTSAMGAGELSITVTPAAIGNSIFDATGARLRSVPFTPERVKAALATAAHQS